MKEKKLLEYKLNYTLDKIPNKITKEEKIIYQLLDQTFNDKNSSTDREDITTILSDRKPSTTKHGYDADGENVEVKPKNYLGTTKLSGDASYSDLTWKRFDNYKKDKPIILISGFYKGKLVFIFEIPFNHPPILKRLEEQLIKNLPNGDTKTKYARKVTFNYSHYKDADIKINFITDNLKLYKDAFPKKLNLYEFLEKNLKKALTSI